MSTTSLVTSILEKEQDKAQHQLLGFTHLDQKRLDNTLEHTALL